MLFVNYIIQRYFAIAAGLDRSNYLIVTGPLCIGQLSVAVTTYPRHMTEREERFQSLITCLFIALGL